MFRVQLNAGGLFAFAMRKDRDEVFTARASGAQVQAITDFMTGRTQPHFGERMHASAFGVYGFERRTDKYANAQRKRLGGVYPYFGPWRRDFSALAVALLRGKGKAVLSAIRTLVVRTVHMREIITKPGVGFTVSQTAGARKITTRLRLPGARVLNALGPKGAIYRRQLLDFRLGNNRDTKAIMARLDYLLGKQLWAPIANEPKRQVIA